MYDSLPKVRGKILTSEDGLITVVLSGGRVVNYSSCDHFYQGEYVDVYLGDQGQAVFVVYACVQKVFIGVI